MNLNILQNGAFKLAIAGHNLYIGGSAGTGKTFLVTKIVEKLRNDHKVVYLTCTTGIACSAYSPSLHSMTIHRFCGMEDGRYSTEEIKTLIIHNMNYQKILDRIKKANVLIIDEISMLSSRLFLQLEEICSIRDPSKVFGGIQIILCGDFYQLPPVANVLYGDEGNFCFENELFEKTITHRVFLREVVRQSEQLLIQAVREASTGNLSKDTLDFIKYLQRPLSESVSDSTKLFATNFLVDDFNRRQLLKVHGEVTEYRARDTGEPRYLQRILAPSRLWLKIGAPVMLLRNISDSLYNGLIGNVVGVDADGPDVIFPTIGVTKKIPRMLFSGKTLFQNN